MTSKLEIASISDLNIDTIILERFFLEKKQKLSDYVLKKGESVVGKKIISNQLLQEIKNLKK